MDRDDDRGALGRYVRERLHREAREHGRGYQADISRRTGLSQTHIANIMNRQEVGVGLDAAAALARAWNMTSAELMDAARRATDARPAPAPSPSAIALPNLDAAIDFVRGRGPISDQALAAARRIGAAAGRDFSAGTWIVLLSDLAASELSAAPPGGTGRA